MSSSINQAKNDSWQEKLNSRGVFVDISDVDDVEEGILNNKKKEAMSANSDSIFTSVKFEPQQIEEQTNDLNVVNLSKQPNSVIQLLDTLYASSSDDEMNDNPCSDLLEPGQVMEESSLPAIQTGMIGVSEDTLSGTNSPSSEVLRPESVLQLLLKNKTKSSSDRLFQDEPSLSLASVVTPEMESSKLIPSKEENSPSPLKTEPEPESEPGMSFSKMLSVNTSAPSSPTNPMESRDHKNKKESDDNVTNPGGNSTFSMMTNYATPSAATAAPSPAADALPSVSSTSARSFSPTPSRQRGVHRGFNKHNILRQSAFEAAQEHAMKTAARSNTAGAADGRRGYSMTGSSRDRDRRDYEGEDHFDRHHSLSRRDRSPEEDYSPPRSGGGGGSVDRTSHDRREGRVSLKEQYSRQPYKHEEDRSPDRAEVGRDDRHHRRYSRSLSPEQLYRDPYRHDHNGGYGVYGDGAGEKAKKRSAAQAAMDEYEKSLLEYESDHDNYKTNRFKTKNSKNITLV